MPFQIRAQARVSASVSHCSGAPVLHVEAEHRLIGVDRPERSRGSARGRPPCPRPRTAAPGRRARADPPRRGTHPRRGSRGACPPLGYAQARSAAPSNASALTPSRGHRATPAQAPTPAPARENDAPGGLDRVTVVTQHGELVPARRPARRPVAGPAAWRGPHPSAPRRRRRAPVLVDRPEIVEVDQDQAAGAPAGPGGHAVHLARKAARETAW